MIGVFCSQRRVTLEIMNLSILSDSMSLKQLFCELADTNGGTKFATSDVSEQCSDLIYSATLIVCLQF